MLSKNELGSTENQERFSEFNQTACSDNVYKKTAKMK